MPRAQVQSLVQALRPHTPHSADNEWKKAAQGCLRESEPEASQRPAAPFLVHCHKKGNQGLEEVFVYSLITALFTADKRWGVTQVSSTDEEERNT